MYNFGKKVLHLFVCFKTNCQNFKTIYSLVKKVAIIEARYLNLSLEAFLILTLNSLIRQI